MIHVVKLMGTNYYKYYMVCLCVRELKQYMYHSAKSTSKTNMKVAKCGEVKDQI